MPSPPEDSQFLAPRSQTSPSQGEPRGEEFDLSQLDKPSEGASPSKWNRPWLWAAGILAAYCFYFWVYGLGVRAQRPMPSPPITAKSASATQIRVHVSGAVRSPGVYSLGANARIGDALAKAGGALPDANANALNLAAFVEDGAKIDVPFKAAPAPKVRPAPVAPFHKAPASPPSSSSAVTTQTAPALAPSGHKDEAALRLHPVDLNAATLEQLQRLPGVGPKMAQRILDYRGEHGRFKSLSDLDSVKGIGEKRMERLGPLVTVK